MHFFKRKKQIKKFAILMPWGRVGSNLVISELLKDRAVIALNEPTTAAIAAARKQAPDDHRFLADKLQAECFDALNSKLRVRPTKTIGGLKISHRSLISPMYFYERLQKEQYVIIRMVRKDFLRCAVSQIRAEQRANEARLQGQKPSWASSSEEDQIKKLPTNPERAFKIAETFEKEHHRMMAYTNHVFGKNSFTLEYEDLLKDPNEFIGQTFAHLGLSYGSDNVLSHKKATPNSLELAIKDYPTFKNYIAKTKYAKFLET